MEHLDILYFLSTLFIGTFSIAIISVISFKTKDKLVRAFLFFFSAFTLIVLENAFNLYINVNIPDIGFVYHVIQFYVDSFAISLVMFALVYNIHVTYNVPNSKVRNILFFILSSASFLIQILMTKIDFPHKIIIIYSNIEAVGLTLQKIILLITIIYITIIGIVYFKNSIEGEKSRQLTYLILGILYVPFMIIDNIYPRITWITFYPLFYDIFGVVTVYNIIKYFFKGQHVTYAEIPDDGFFKKYEISPRERDVLLLILEGCNNKEICGKLFISLSTVKTHISNIFQKLKVESRFELITLIKKTNLN